MKLKDLFETPDYAYSKFNNRDEDFKKIKWVTNVKNNRGTDYVEILAKVDDKLVGDIRFILESKEKTTYVYGIKINSSWKGTGLGQTLYDKAILWAIDNDYQYFCSDYVRNMSKDAFAAWTRLENRYYVEQYNGKYGACLRIDLDKVLGNVVTEAIFQKPILPETERNRILQELAPLYNIDDMPPVVLESELGISKMSREDLGHTKWTLKKIDGFPDPPYLLSVIINPMAARDKKIYRQVVAHELCHVENLQRDIFPRFIENPNVKIEDDHGPMWQAIANRINRKLGTNYVNKFSDTRYSIFGNLKRGPSLRGIKESPDFGYKSFVNRDEDISKLRWTVKNLVSSGEAVGIIATNESMSSTDYIARLCLQLEEENGKLFRATVRLAQISSGWKGTGLGQILYDKAISFAKKKGCRFFCSDVQRTMEAESAWQKLKNRYPVEKHDNYYIIDLSKV